MVQILGFSGNNGPSPGLDGGGSFCRRTDSRLRNAGSGSSPACLTRAGGVDLSADTDREKRASFDRQASATDSVSFLGLFQPKANKTVFFFVSFHQGVTQSGILFLVSIERGTSPRVYHHRPWLSDMSQLGGAPCRFLARPGCGTRRCVGPTRARTVELPEAAKRRPLSQRLVYTLDRDLDDPSAR